MSIPFRFSQNVILWFNCSEICSTVTLNTKIKIDRGASGHTVNSNVLPAVLMRYCKALLSSHLGSHRASLPNVVASSPAAWQCANVPNVPPGGLMRLMRLMRSCSHAASLTAARYSNILSVGLTAIRTVKYFPWAHGLGFTLLICRKLVNAPKVGPTLPKGGGNNACAGDTIGAERERDRNEREIDR